MTTLDKPFIKDDILRAYDIKWSLILCISPNSLIVFKTVWVTTPAITKSSNNMKVCSWNKALLNNFLSSNIILVSSSVESGFSLMSITEATIWMKRIKETILIAKGVLFAIVESKSCSWTPSDSYLIVGYSLSGLIRVVST